MIMVILMIMRMRIMMVTFVVDFTLNSQFVDSSTKCKSKLLVELTQWVNLNVFVEPQ